MGNGLVARNGEAAPHTRGRTDDDRGHPCTIAALRKSPAAFARRSIPAGYVAPRSLPPGGISRWARLSACADRGTGSMLQALARLASRSIRAGAGRRPSFRKSNAGPRLEVPLGGQLGVTLASCNRDSKHLSRAWHPTWRRGSLVTHPRCAPLSRLATWAPRAGTQAANYGYGTLAHGN